MPLTHENAWNAQPDGRSREELFEAIVVGIKNRAARPLSDTQAQSAARLLIRFCRELSGFGQDGVPGKIDPIVQSGKYEDGT